MRPDSDLPKSNKQIKYIAVVLAITTAILIYIDVKIRAAIVVSNQKSTLNMALSIIENIMAGLTTAFILAITYRLIIQFIDPADRVIEIEALNIGRRLRSNARKTTSYTFIGNTATFVVSTIIPTLCDAARTTGKPVAIKIFVIDPRDSNVVQSYIRHKNRTQQSLSKVADLDTASWTRPSLTGKSETSNEVIAKLVSCIYLSAYASKCAGISLDMYLQKSFTPFRADITDNEVIQTQEAPNEPAVAFSANGHYYGWHHKEAETLAPQCFQLKFSDQKFLEDVVISHPTSSRELIEASLKRLLNKLRSEQF